MKGVRHSLRAYAELGFVALLRMALAGSCVFLLPGSAHCQSAAAGGTRLAVQRLPGNGYWIAGNSALKSVSSIADIRLAAVAGDSVFGFWGAGVPDLPTTLYLLTNGLSAPVPVHAFPAPLREERLLPTSFGNFLITHVSTNTSLPRSVSKGDQTLTNSSYYSPDKVSNTFFKF